MRVRMWTPSSRSPAPPLPSAAGRRAPAPSPGEAPATPMADPGLPLGPGPRVVGAGRWVRIPRAAGAWSLGRGPWVVNAGHLVPMALGSIVPWSLGSLAPRGLDRCVIGVLSPENPDNATVEAGGGPGSPSSPLSSPTSLSP